ncbi:MAG: prepilin-type N-terminal cleavage/methylation domain-containing protein [Desulfobacterales bacterium]|nr:prepilin-type N-terminal cleavage/methylation domain-containing protein [Desulfobacterales bacterium]
MNPINRTKGYTLIELTVVVFLIGIMLALSVPRFRYGLFSDTLKVATRRMIGTVKSLRNKAVQDQKAYRLHFDLESERLWIEWNQMTNEEQAVARGKASGLRGGIRILDVCRTGKGKSDVGETAIHFTKKGYVEQAVIHLGSDDGRAHTIELSPFLGTIKTYDKYVEIETIL